MTNKFKKTILYLKKYRLRSFAIFLFVVFGSFLEVFNIGLLFTILQGVIGNENLFYGIPLLGRLSGLFNGFRRVDTLSVLLVFYLITFTLKNIIFYFGNVAISKQRLVLTKDLQMDFFDKLMDAGIKFYDSSKSGHIINSIYNETTLIGNFMNCVLRIFGMGTRLFVNLTILFVISWKFTLFAFLSFILIRIPLSFIRRRLRALGVIINGIIADFNSTVLEAISGIRVIRIFSAEKYERHKFKEITDKCRDYNYVIRKNAELILPLTQILFLGIFVVFFLILIRITTITFIGMIPYLAAYLYVAKNAMTDFGGLQDCRTEAVGCLGAFDSYEEYLRKMEDNVMAGGSRRFDVLSKEIKFEDVYFGYSPDSNVLNGVSLVIPVGKTTAIVGSSAAGKTTLAHLLLRFYDPLKGRITVDDIDLRELDLHSWRTKIGVVSQDAFIFNASAHDNIAYGQPNASDEKIRAVARIAEIDDYIIGLPKGYNTLLGERGVKLSGGQKQRVSIARALLQNPQILILDEATSHLDTKTEKQIQQAIDELAKNRTVVVIAHRLSTIDSANDIIVLDKGRIVEQGSHSFLLSLNGHYSQLCKMQFIQKTWDLNGKNI